MAKLSLSEDNGVKFLVAGILLFVFGTLFGVALQNSVYDHAQSNDSYNQSAAVARTLGDSASTTYPYTATSTSASILQIVSTAVYASSTPYNLLPPSHSGCSTNLSSLITPFTIADKLSENGFGQKPLKPDLRINKYPGSRLYTVVKLKNASQPIDGIANFKFDIYERIDSFFFDTSSQNYSEDNNGTKNFLMLSGNIRVPPGATIYCGRSIMASNKPGLRSVLTYLNHPVDDSVIKIILFSDPVTNMAPFMIKKASSNSALDTSSKSNMPADVISSQFVKNLYRRKGQ